MTSQDVRITPRGTAPEAAGGCSCCTPSADAAAAQPAPSTAEAPSTTTYQVTGMTCGHCVSAVREEVAALDGVTGVDVDLVAGGTSTITVTATAPLSRNAVAAAVDEAGYALAR